jgi:hypothetical protein
MPGVVEEMTRLIPEKLRVKFLPGMTPDSLETPRYYTLTHSDTTGDLFLSIVLCYDTKQTSKLYTRLMRDEVLAELTKDSNQFVLKVHCHVSGGLVFGRAKWRYDIFCSELSLALEAIRYGDKTFFEQNPQLDKTPVKVHFKSSSNKYNKTENWGTIADYKT